MTRQQTFIGCLGCLCTSVALSIPVDSIILVFSTYSSPYLFLSLSLCLSVCLSLWLSIFLSVSLPISLSLSPSLSFHLSVCVSLFVSLCLCICPYFSLSLSRFLLQPPVYSITTSKSFKLFQLILKHHFRIFIVPHAHSIGKVVALMQPPV